MGLCSSCLINSSLILAFLKLTSFSAISVSGRTRNSSNKTCPFLVRLDRKLILIRKPLRQHQVPPSSCNRKMSDHQCAGSLERAPAPFHAQDLLLNSSSWVGQVLNFRQEIRQSHYRNDPVKYDLNMQYAIEKYQPNFKNEKF